jgi:hypothetical protein
LSRDDARHLIKTDVVVRCLWDSKTCVIIPQTRILYLFLFVFLHYLSHVGMPPSLFDGHGAMESEYAVRLVAALVGANASSGTPTGPTVGSDGPVSGFAAESSDRRRVAVATLHYGSSSGACGIVKWCYSAAALVNTPFLRGRADAVVLTDKTSTLNGTCWPSPRVLTFDAALLRLTRLWTAARRASGERAQNNGHKALSNFSSSQLMKWQLASLTEYEAVLYLDTDIDLFLLHGGRPPPALTAAGAMLRRTWSAAIDAFVRSGLELLATSDPHVPISGGAFLLRPSSDVYAAGVAVLRHAVAFNYSHGFELRGPPQSVLRAPPPARHSLRTLAPSATAAPSAAPSAAMAAAMAAVSMAAPVERTRMWRRNTWNVVDGDGDQGLLAYVFLALRRGATVAHVTRAAPWRVNHFFGPHKPWGRHARCLAYFDFTRQHDFERAVAEGRLLSNFASRCLRRFEEKRTCLAPRTNLDCRECRRRRDKNVCAPNATAKCPRSTRWWIF